MRVILLSVALIGAAAVAGCGASKGNGSANAAGNAGASAATGGDAVARAAFREQCIQTMRRSPNIPAGFDVADACTCSIERTFANRTDVATYMDSPAGEQAYSQAVTQCLAERGAVFRQPAGAAQAPATGAAENDPPAEDADAPPPASDEKGE